MADSPFANLGLVLMKAITGLHTGLARALSPTGDAGNGRPLLTDLASSPLWDGGHGKNQDHAEQKDEVFDVKNS
jgi:hypothetical protein